MPVKAANLATDAKRIVRDLLLSFETGEQVTDMRVYPPDSCDWELVEARYEVVKELANTNAGTIDIEAGSTTDDAITQISIPLSSAIGTRGTATLSTTLSRLRIGGGQTHAYHAVTTAKANAGGKVMLSLTYQRVTRNAPA